MELSLQRYRLSHEATGGDLSVDGVFECYTVELPVKDGLPGSAIPPGKYLIDLAPSPKFLASEDIWVKQFASLIPHLLGIPHRSDILIHWGNSAHDTNGCILVGDIQEVNGVGASRVAFGVLHDKLVAARDRGEAISIEVRGGIPDAPGLPGATLDASDN